MKVGDIVERDGIKYAVTNVYILGGGEAFETEIAEEFPAEEIPAEEAPKKRRTRKK